MRPIVVSAPLPTIEEGNDWGEVANLRRSVTATQRQRTALTFELNRKLRAFCGQQKLAYIALDRASLGEDGLVSRALLSRNPLDHYYDKRAYAELLAAPVAAALGQGRAQTPHGHASGRFPTQPTLPTMRAARPRIRRYLEPRRRPAQEQRPR